LALGPREPRRRPFSILATFLRSDLPDGFVDGQANGKLPAAADRHDSVREKSSDDADQSSVGAEQ
jgi:hypothetical protein